MLEHHKILTGYDPHGTVYDAQNYVLRKIASQKISQTKKLYSLYQKHTLKKMGIVETEIFTETPDLILKHKKHIISYPHEWTVSMFKQATLFHLNLLIELDDYNLTLKDALPNNIVFDFYNSIFVDFLSLIPKDELATEDWLIQISKKNKKFFHTIFDEMFFPYFLVPYIMMSRGDYAQARHILLEHACNINPQKPSWNMLLEKSVHRTRMQRYTETLKLYFMLWLDKKLSLQQFCKKLHNFLEIKKIAPSASHYSSYYEEKNENLSFVPTPQWHDKQKNVYAVLNAEKPQRVLDLGANTGWFSILAAKQGAEVIATDIDEASINQLFLYTQKQQLPILTLLLPFENLTKKTFGLTQNDPCYEEKNFGKNPIFLAATDRLQSDMVLCLALIHHLILGSGHNLVDVIQTLSDLCNKTLVLEFVSIDDPLIVNNQSFFKNITKHSSETYNLDLVIKAGLNHFRTYEIVGSHPATRKLIIFKK
ncbi:MAG: methyltransferase domain-containing protein [bacterium]